MKIIFLDFDGVLNIHKGMFYKSCVDNLNYIINKTSAKIVISSSWREYNSIEQLKNTLEEHGFKYKNNIIGVLPILIDYVDNHGFPVEKSRKDEIDEYLKMNQDMIDNYLIIDDNIFENMREMSYVETDWDTGLDVESALIAIGELNGE